MKSVLPPELESKRLTIAKTHNRLVLMLLAGMFAGIFLLVGITPVRGPRAWPYFLVGMIIVLGLEGYGIFRIFKYDEQLCAQLGFMCPHCRKPLYEPRGFINLNGRCPKCKKSIIS